ncbi:MAG TPA: carbamoyltransferase HypF [bacterium]|nr:carbamoyltransferase HypF [bacterium]
METQTTVMREGRRISIQGVVPGVGFRAWVSRVARSSGVDGRVRANPSGIVIEAFGRHDALDAFVSNLKADPPPGAKIRALMWESMPLEEIKGFVVFPPAHHKERHESLPPDLALCDDCLAEIFSPQDRRFRYAFTSCGRCGPRFSITSALPFERANTRMASFAMCDECQQEVETSGSRRQGAATNACPVCGPRLTLVDAFEVEVPGLGDALARTAKALEEGKVVALKTMGGFRLAVRADRAEAVRTLRARKKRDELPFAVMVRTLEEARSVAAPDELEEEALSSAARPIVLVRRRDDSILVEEVAPDNPRVGLMLAGTAMEHLLLADARVPIAVTSANLAGEPVASRNAEAFARLRGIADVFLVHDLEIENPCEDSVARIVAGQTCLHRRSRGYVPGAIPVAGGFAQPVLATGAQTHAAFCVGLGQSAFLGPHIGALDNPDTLASFDAAINRFLGYLRIAPTVIAHDLHPAWASTRWARERAAKGGQRLIAVQHHHAHVASAMAEHGLARPVLGLAFDAGGYGDDGTSWGGEFLFADAEGYRRLATFRPLALAGGDRAMQDVWRLALAMLDDAFGIEGWSVEDYPLFYDVGTREISIVRRMIAHHVNAPATHALGRWFDAIGALGLARPRATFDGQVARAWDFAAAEGRATRAYPWDIDEHATPWQIDLRPAVRAAAVEVRVGTAPGIIAAKFHETIIAAATEVARRLLREVGRVPIVLTGDSFENARLAEGLLGELVGYTEVFLHGLVPPGDGGIAAGQAVVADAIVRKDG